MKKVLVINSAKGGVGKTEITIGIAKELFARGEQVSILDLDVTTPNIGKINNVKTYSAGANTMLNKTQIKRLIKTSLEDVADGWILIDTPPTISSLYSAITETVKNAKFLFVTTPSKNAVLDTSVGIKFFAQRGVVPIGLIQSMTGEMFGSTFNSVDRMGVNTLGEIPLTKDEDKSKYFKPIVENLKNIEFENISIEADKIKIFSTLTKEEVEKIELTELKFYNLETWEAIRDKLIAQEFMYADMSGHEVKSHFDISTNKLKEIIDKGYSTTIMVTKNISVEKAPLPYEIQEAEIVYDDKVSKGLPMFRLHSGVMLWHHECMLIDDLAITETMENGGIDMGDSRIIQSLYSQMYYRRAFERGDLDGEVKLIKRHIEETAIVPTSKYIIYSIYSLEKDGDASYDDFNMNEYIEANKKDYPQFYEYLVEVKSLSTEDKKADKDD